MLTEEYVLIIVEYCVVRICSVENDVYDVESSFPISCLSLVLVTGPTVMQNSLFCP